MQQQANTGQDKAPMTQAPTTPTSSTPPTSPTPTTPPEPEPEKNYARACAIARGEAPPSGQWARIRGGHKDYNARGRCREHWYRMVWRGGWQYVSADRLAVGTERASERQDTTWGEAQVGEIVVQHDRGGPIDKAYIVVAAEGEQLLAACTLRRREGRLVIGLPDGTKIERPDPRR